MSADAEPHDPYVRLSHREVYRNRWIGVEAHEITHPGGAAGEHVLIRSSPSIGVVILDGDDVLLTQQPRFAARREVIEIVKGGRDPGEAAVDAVKREAEEELGIVLGRVESLGQAWELPSLMEQPILLFCASEISAGRAEPEDTESIVPVRLAFAQAIEMALSGELDDAVTSTALLRAAAHMGRLAPTR